MKHSLHHEHFAAWSVLVLVVGVAPLCPERAIAVDTPSWGGGRGKPLSRRVPQGIVSGRPQGQSRRVGWIASPPSVPLGCRPS